VRSTAFSIFLIVGAGATEIKRAASFDLCCSTVVMDRLMASKTSSGDGSPGYLMERSDSMVEASRSPGTRSAKADATTATAS
jgi:hypothetical protein